MSAQSGGSTVSKALEMDTAPVNNEEATNAIKRQAVTRKREVELVFAQAVGAEAVINAIVSAVNPPQQIEGIQMINAKKFLISFKTVNSAELFHSVSAPVFNVRGLTPSCRWLGVERKIIRVSFLPFAVPNSELVAVLKRYGRVLNVTDEIYSNLPGNIKTGTRLVEMEMSEPVPNIITVCGFSVPATYRGVVMQCRRCHLQGHLRAACNTPFCDRCKSFGHKDGVCKAPCLKCKSADHHWRDCTVRSYAFIAATVAPALDLKATICAETATVANPIGSPGQTEINAVAAGRPNGMADNDSTEGVAGDASFNSAIGSTSDLTVEGALFNSSADAGSDINAAAVPPPDAYDSNLPQDGAAENDSLTGGKSSAAARNTNKDRGKSVNKKDGGEVDQSEASAAPTQHADEETSGGPWQSARLRSNKRKTVSITPEKIPCPKKVAGETARH